MARTISATEAKAKLSALINWAIKNRDEIIVESRGDPKAVIISYASYEQFKALREQARRKELLGQLEALAAEVHQRNQDLSEEEANELADRFTREVIEEMAAEGKINYRQD